MYDSFYLGGVSQNSPQVLGVQQSDPIHTGRANRQRRVVKRYQNEPLSRVNLIFEPLKRLLT